MNKPQNLNARNVMVEPSDANQFQELDKNHPEGAQVILSNMTDQAVYVTSKAVDTETISFPAAGDDFIGQIIPAGVMATYAFNPSERYLYYIAKAAATGCMSVAIGEGS